MAILETFYILYKAETSDAEKANEKIVKSNQDVEKSLKNTGTASDKVGASFLNLSKSFLNFAAAAVSVTAVLAAVKAGINYSFELDQASRALGVNVEELDAWGNAVRKTGGDIQSFQSSLRGLAQHTGTSTQVALKLLPQLASAFQSLGRVRALNYGKMLGLDESTILLLQKGRREVTDLILRQKELGVVTKRDAEISRNFNFALQDTGHAFRSVFIAVGSTVLPVLTEVLEKFTNVALYFKHHADLIIGSLIAIGAAATIAAIPFIATNAAIIGLTTAIGVAIAAFAIAYEDIKAFLNGQDSLTGRMLERWPAVGRVIKLTLEGIAAQFKVIIGLGHILERIFDKVGSFFTANPKLKSVIELGKNQLSNASSSPLASQTSTSIFNSKPFNNASSFNIGDITINTQATDAEGIAGAVGLHLRDQLWQANSNFDNGILA